MAAQEYLDRNELGSAETILRSLLEKAPGDHRAHELLGRVLYTGWVLRPGGDGSDARLREAAAHYRRAVEHARGLDGVSAAGLHQSAGEIAAAAGDDDEALRRFREAGVLDSTNPKHPLYEAQILMRTARTGEAEAALERVLALDPDEPFAHATLAAVALERGDREAAFRHVVNARRIDPASLPLRIQEARVRRLGGAPREALLLLVGLGAEERAEEAVASEMAECYRTLGEPGRASAVWEHRYRHHPAAWRAAVRAGQAGLEAGDPERARYWLGLAKLAAPEAPEVRALESALAPPGR